MIDDLRYPDDYIEQLEAEIHKVRLSHNQLMGELSDVYGSKAYRVGSLARAAYIDPLNATKKVLRLAKNSRRISPKAFYKMRNATPYSSSLFDVAYETWQKDFEPGSEELDEQRAKAVKFTKQPVFSIITPVFQPPRQVLIDLIESMLDQTYPNFELCLGEFSGNQECRSILTEYAAKDNRIKVKFFDSNDGIAANSNLCLELATGEYVGLLDHDDLLSPDALYENAKMINSKDYDFIYSDKDKIDEAGNRFDPMFKPDWSPELMLTANYLTHFNVFKRSLLNKIGGWDKQTDGAQDWDLFFRLIAAGKSVGHIPKILYHWRVIATSTAMSITTKPYALEGQRRALAKYFDSLNIKQPKIVHSKEGALSLSWGSVAIAEKTLRCIIVSDKETAGQAYKLARKLAKTKRLNLRDITIYFSDDPKQSFGELVSKEKSKADMLLFADAKLHNLSRATSIDELVGWASIPGVGIASPHIHSKYGVLLEAGRVIGLGASLTPLFAGENYIPGIFGYREWSRNVSVPSMNCFMINTKAIGSKNIKQNGTQGVRELVLTSLTNGYRTVVTPFDSATLNSTAIYEPALSEQNQKLIKLTMPNLEDPFFSSNLSVTRQYPLFITSNEVASRAKTIASFMDQPIEYDPSIQSFSQSSETDNKLPLVGYKRDAFILSGITDYASEDIANSRKITDSTQSIDDIESALWILPYFTTLYAGLKNVFALASRMSTDEGTKHTFYIATQEDVEIIRDIVSAVFPVLSNAEFIDAEGYDTIKDSRKFTIGICSLWTTAYYLLHNNNLKRKLYIIQDDERSFYPRGSIYALVNATYNFGFWGIAGTKALASWYAKREGHKYRTSVLSSDLDLATYLKLSSSSNNKKTNKLPRVLFYARPDAQRNAFELGLHGLNRLAEKMNGKIEIVLAGADFDLDQYEGTHPAVRVAGKVPYSELAVFYASFDAALFLMFSEHPGVFPLEMMASSVPVVVNAHHSDSWKELYQDGKTCLLSETSASSIASALHSVLSDPELRHKLVKGGRLLAQQQNSLSYEDQAKNTIQLIKHRGHNESK